MLKIPESKYSIFSCNLVSCIKTIKKNPRSSEFWLLFFFSCENSQMDHILPAARSSLSYRSVCASWHHMTWQTGPDINEYNPRCIFIRAPLTLPILFPFLFSFLKNWSLKNSFQTRLPFTEYMENQLLAMIILVYTGSMIWFCCCWDMEIWWFKKTYLYIGGLNFTLFLDYCVSPVPREIELV